MIWTIKGFITLSRKGKLLHFWQNPIQPVPTILITYRVERVPAPAGHQACGRMCYNGAIICQEEYW